MPGRMGSWEQWGGGSSARCPQQSCSRGYNYGHQGECKVYSGTSRAVLPTSLLDGPLSINYFMTFLPSYYGNFQTYTQIEQSVLQPSFNNYQLIANLTPCIPPSPQHFSLLLHYCNISSVNISVYVSKE